MSEEEVPNAGRREDRIELWVGQIRGELARESTWLNIIGARAVREGKIKMTDEKRPQCWARSSVAFHFGDK